jgi:non-ribosomal peptide synthetase component F
MHSSVNIDTFNGEDTVIQMARCSFDIHVQEILGTLMHGATVVMIHPRGSIDFEYLSTILAKKQITYMNHVPSFLHSFFTFIKECNNQVAIKHFRSLVSGGE